MKSFNETFIIYLSIKNIIGSLQNENNFNGGNLREKKKKLVGDYSKFNLSKKMEDIEETGLAGLATGTISISKVCKNHVCSKTVTTKFLNIFHFLREFLHSKEEPNAMLQQMIKEERKSKGHEKLEKTSKQKPILNWHCSEIHLQPNLSKRFTIQHGKQCQTR